MRPGMGRFGQPGPPRQLNNPCRMAPSLALSLAHQPSSTTHASVGVSVHRSNVQPHIEPPTRLRIWPTVYFPFSCCKLSVGPDRHCITVSVCATLSAISSPRLICLSFRPAPRVAPPLQSNMAAITSWPVGWGNKSLSPIAFYACVRACKIDPGCSNWNTCINALF